MEPSDAQRLQADRGQPFVPAPVSHEALTTSAEFETKAEDEGTISGASLMGATITEAASKDTTLMEIGAGSDTLPTSYGGCSCAP